MKLLPGNSSHPEERGSLSIVAALMIAPYAVRLIPGISDAQMADGDGNETVTIPDALTKAQFHTSLIPSPATPFSAAGPGITLNFTPQTFVLRDTRKWICVFKTLASPLI